MDCAGDTPRLALAQKPYRPIGAEGGAEQTWQVPVCVRWGAGAGDRQCTLLKSARAEVVLETGTRLPGLGAAERPGTGYYRVGYRSEQLPRLLEDGGSKLSLAERVSLLEDLAALVRSGEIGAADALSVIPLALKDPSRHLVSATASLVSETTADIVPDELRPRLARFIRDTYGERARALSWKAKAGEDEDTGSRADPCSTWWRSGARIPRSAPRRWSWRGAGSTTPTPSTPTC